MDIKHGLERVTVIGAGLAGCEAAWQLAERGVDVVLIEQKPKKFSPAHKSIGFCELVCSNSLKASRLNSAAGLLKAEMERLHSLTVPIAKSVAVPAGGALAVDRHRFSDAVSDKIRSHPKIEVRTKVENQIPDGIAVVATGPLTDGEFSENLKKLTGEMLSFYDAAAPIITADSVDMERAFVASRYDDDAGDYINCPMDKDEYERFYDALIAAERAVLHDFDKIYEGCVPIEVLARKGRDTMRFGPLKPVGLCDPKTGRRPYANLQLRRETAAGELYNLVGFQTNLKFSEQKRVFSLIPALHNAEFERYGVMHRNSFINAPGLLNRSLSLKKRQNLFIAGQLSGVEGYMESAASGIMCGINAARLLKGEPPLILPEYTMIGALINYICTENKNFQPMGAAMGLLPPLGERIKDRLERYGALARRSMEFFDGLENA